MNKIDFAKPAIFAGFDDYAVLADGDTRYLILLKACKKTGGVSEGSGVISDYYTTSNIAYHAAKRIAEMLRGEGYSAAADPNVNVKELIVRSGLGVRGMNTLTYHTRFGSYFSADVIETDAPFHECLREPPTSLCADCGICRDLCPTGALRDRSFERKRCIRHWMDLPNGTPRDMLGFAGTRLLGCEECQRSCPMNAQVSEAFCDDELISHTDLHDIAVGRPETMEYLKARFGANYAGNRMRAQSLVCLYNSGSLNGALLEELILDRSPKVASLAKRLSLLKDNSDD